MLLVVLLGAWACKANPIFEEDGVLVHQDGDVRRIGAAWSVVVIIQPPPLLRTELLDATLEAAFTQAATRFGKKAAQHWRTRWHALKHMLSRHTRQVVQEQVMVDAERTRIKRGWFNFVGRMVRPLFNIPDFTDIEALRKLIMNNSKEGLSIRHHAREMVTMINATRAMLQDSVDHIELVHNMSREALRMADANRKLVREDLEEVNGLKVARSLDLALQEAHFAFINYIQALKDYHQKRMEVERGWLTENIVSMEQLDSIIELIGQKGYETLPREWYYQYVAVIPMWEGDDHVAFRAVLPAVDEDCYIKYSLLYVPVPMGGEHMRVIQGRDSVVLHTMTQASFTPLNCLGKAPNVCWPEVENLGGSCESQLVNGNLPGDCGVKVFVMGNKSSIVERRGALDSEVIVAPGKKGENLVMRCKNEPPLKIMVGKPTVLPVPEGCVLESPRWRVKSVVHVHEELKQKRVEPIALPRLNVSWPTTMKAQVVRSLMTMEHVTIPLIHMVKWEKQEEEGGMTAEEWMGTMSHPYVTAGSSGVAVLICGVVLIMNVYCWCCSGKMRLLAQWARVPTQESTPTAPPMAQVQAASPPLIINVPPPPPYQGREDAAPSVSVTITPEQVAKLIGFTPRRSHKALAMS